MAQRSHRLLVAYAAALGVLPSLVAGTAFASNSAYTRHSPSVFHATTARDSALQVAQATTSQPDVLKLGSQGQSVTELQTRLKQLGYYNSEISGLYGDATKTAVIEFQRAEGLAVDGQVGELTWQRLQTVSAQSRPQGDTASTDASAEAASDNPAAEPSVAEASEDSNRPVFNTVITAESAAIDSSAPDWMWWAGGVAVVGAVLGGILYKINRSEAVHLVDDQPVAHTPPRTKVAANGSSPEATPVSIYVDVEEQGDRNGSQSLRSDSAKADGVKTATVKSGSARSGSAKSSATTLQHESQTVSATTRLAKVDIVEELINDLHSPDPTQRRKAIWELGQRGDSKAIQPLVDLMIDADSQQRSLILASISEIGTRALLPMNRALLLSLQDESSDVRKNAIRDLTRVYDQMVQMSQILSHAVDDSDREVQETARWALGQLNRIRPLPEGELPSSLPSTPSSQE